MKKTRYIILICLATLLCSCKTATVKTGNMPDEASRQVIADRVIRPVDWTDRVAATNYWQYLIDKHDELVRKFPDKDLIVFLATRPDPSIEERYGDRKELLDLAYAMHVLIHNDEFQPDEDPPEQWLRPLEEGDSAQDISNKILLAEWALRAEFELYVLEKYADWPEERIRQRLGELQASGDHSKEREREEDELKILLYDALPNARRRAIPPPDRELRSARHEQILRTEDALKLGTPYRQAPMAVEDMAAPNLIIERLNATAKTNALLRNYWELTREGLWDGQYIQ